jgi:hypothetical protein
MAPKVMKQLTLQGLRMILSEQIEAIREGKATASNVNAISNATGKILSSIKLELEYHKLVGKTPHMAAMIEETSDEEMGEKVAEFQGRKTQAI